MKINNQHYRSIWWNDALQLVQIIDQRYLPHQLVIQNLCSLADCATAIRDMWVRGAPLIGVTAAYGMYYAALQANNNNHLQTLAQQLIDTRPTAVNLQWAVEQQLNSILAQTNTEKHAQLALQNAHQIANQDVEICRMIGVHGLNLLQQIAQKKETINILTHCNAGWLACTDWGTATSPIYQAAQAGINVHVWVSETRPRNQGANLTAWELNQNNIAHTLVVDNCCGHLLQHGMVDICIVGTDRTTYTGDVANKIGTYLKALAAHDNNVPFYVALPSSTIDWETNNGIQNIPIEQRNPNEVRYVSGLHNGTIKEVLITPASTPAANYAFDVTPARLVTGLITEKGICPATQIGIAQLFNHQTTS